MAYGIKYQLWCKGKDSVISKSVISEDGYEGAELDRNVPANPFHLIKDAAAVISGTSFEFLIREITDFEFLSFYTNKPKKFKIEFYYPSSTLIWSGYLNPQQYSVPYIPGPTNIRFQATDGLGLLKNEDFTLTGFNSDFAKIIHCLDKIGLGLDYSIAIGIHEVTHDPDRSPLEQTFDECEIYEGKNCYEVLEDILTKYDATLTQWNNRWRIVSYKDKKLTRLLYTSAGVYETTEAAPAVLDLGSLDGAGCEVYPSGSLHLSLQSGGNNVKIKHEYGRKDSFLLNSNFSKYASSAFPGWSKEGSFIPEQKFNFKVINEDQTYAFLPGSGTNHYLYQSIDIVKVAGEDFVFSIKMGAIGYLLYGGIPIPTLMTVRMLISLTSGEDVMYLNTSEWTSTPSYIDTEITSNIGGVPKMNPLTIITNEIPFSGTLKINLYRYGTTEYNHVFIGVAFTSVNFYFVLNNELYPDKFEDTATFDDSTEPAKLPDIALQVADAPDLANALYLYRNITKLSDGSITTTWNIDGIATDFTLIEALLKMLASRNIHARQMLKGVIKGTGIGFESLIKHAYNDNREFEIHECQWDVYAAKFSVTLLEFLSFTDQDITWALGGVIAGLANLAVTAITPSAYSIVPENSFNTTVRVSNSGTAAGRKNIEWKIVDDTDATISAGTYDSGTIAASGYSDHVVGMTSPPDVGTYYVKCKTSADVSWETSSAITVAEPDVTLDHLDVIMSGVANDPMNIGFEATNNGPAGNVEITYHCYDSSDAVLFTGSQVIYFNAGTDTYHFTGINYHSVPGSNYYFGIETMLGIPVLSNDFNVT